MSTFRFSARSERKLIGVHPLLVKIARRALELTAVDFGVTEGLRTETRQRYLISVGRSRTMNSRHLTGHAIDIACYLGSEVTWDMKYYRMANDAFQAAAKELGEPVQWGGNWTTLRDGPHFQLPWLTHPK